MVDIAQLVERVLAVGCLALGLAPACSGGSSGGRDGGGDGSTTGCNLGGVHYVEGQTYCCGQDDQPTASGNTCICLQGQIESDGIACGFDAGAMNDGSGPGD